MELGRWGGNDPIEALPQGAIEMGRSDEGRQAVVIPLFGRPPADLPEYLHRLAEETLLTVLVDNRPSPEPSDLWRGCEAVAACTIPNGNVGGVAGGYNRGVCAARRLGADVITLLDQDSRLTGAQLRRLARDLQNLPNDRIVLGPWVMDQRRGTPIPPEAPGLRPTRMLISSGTTFRALDWHDLGPMHEPLEVDYVDHHWCFRAISRGFRFYQQPEIVLAQVFGERHPSGLCHRLGMQLYPPRRHYTVIRNLRWLIVQSYVPLDFKLKESARLLVKPIFWLIFEPQRLANLKAILLGLINRPANCQEYNDAP
jgi:rhamnosyltransferase